MLFSTPLTCTAIINQTASADRLDVIIGFETGDLLWLDPILGKYTRLNKNVRMLLPQLVCNLTDYFAGRIELLPGGRHLSRSPTAYPFFSTFRR